MERPITLWIQFDAFLINWFEKKCCHKIQRLTGYTNYALFRITIALCGIGYMAIPFVFPNSFGIYDKIFRSFVCLLCLFVSHQMPVHEKIAFQELEAGFANPRKKCWRWRLFFIGITLMVYVLLGVALATATIISALAWWYSLLVSLCIFSIYLLSCDPLPPQSGKIRKWIDSFFLKPIRVKE